VTSTDTKSCPSTTLRTGGSPLNPAPTGKHVGILTYVQTKINKKMNSTQRTRRVFSHE
jgi:hypothetical protein